MNKKYFFDFFLILLIFCVDRLSKFWVIKIFSLTEKLEIVIFPFLNINLIWNEGIAFGLFSLGDKNLYNLLTVIILIVVIIILLMMIKTNGIEKYGFLLIFGGSLGNIFDRFFYSAVPDFIDIYYRSFHWFIFNVADIFITLGVFLLIFKELFLKGEKLK